MRSPQSVKYMGTLSMHIWSLCVCLICLVCSLCFAPCTFSFFGSEVLHSVLVFMLDNLKHLHMTFCAYR